MKKTKAGPRKQKRREQRKAARPKPKAPNAKQIVLEEMNVSIDNLSALFNQMGDLLSAYSYAIQEGEDLGKNKNKIVAVLDDLNVAKTELGGIISEYEQRRDTYEADMAGMDKEDARVEGIEFCTSVQGDLDRYSELHALTLNTVINESE